MYESISSAGCGVSASIQLHSGSAKKVLTNSFFGGQGGQGDDLVTVGYTVHHVEARIFPPREESDDFHFVDLGPSSSGALEHRRPEASKSCATTLCTLGRCGGCVQYSMLHELVTKEVQ